MHVMGWYLVKRRDNFTFAFTITHLAYVMTVFCLGLGIFLFDTMSRPVLGPIQPPMQRVSGTLFLGVKRSGREADHSSPPIAEVKNAWSYASTPPYIFMAWCLVKHRDNFTLTFTFRNHKQTYS
jgi:hypothetical protein